MDDAHPEPRESAIFVLEHEVRDDEIDALGHVNNLAYLKWMIAAAVAHSAACGWTTERYLKSGGGWVVRSHKIEYFDSALANDRITVRTWVAGFKKVTSLRRYRIVRDSDQTLLAEAETNWAFIGFEHRVPRRIPQQIIDDFDRFQSETESSGGLCHQHNDQTANTSNSPGGHSPPSKDQSHEQHSNRHRRTGR